VDRDHGSDGTGRRSISRRVHREMVEIGLKAKGK
jgi:hypothetical protein